MGALRRHAGAALLAAALCGCAGRPDAASAGRADAEIGLARDYVFASCLIATHRGTPIADEADAWAAGLVARGTLPADAYPALAAIVRTMAPSTPTAMSGRSVALAGCAALRDDPAVTARIATIVARRPAG